MRTRGYAMGRDAGLTQKQEAFALAYVETGNASEAYRRSYNAENTKPEVIWVKASEVLSHGKVSVRVAELQMKAQERTLVTVASITQELEDARKKADDLGNPAAMTGAIMGKAKVNGLLVDRSDVKSAVTISLESDADNL